MAKLKQNGSKMGISGMIGKGLVFRQLRDGRTIVSVAPDFTDRVFSEGQVAHQSRFKQAVAYARVAAKTNPLYAELAQRKATNAYNLALSDWFHEPVIEEVKCLSGSIQVRAHDNIRVSQVRVTICDEQGQRLEQGEAQETHGGWWEYRTSTSGTVLVEAFDLAGNITRQQVTQAVEPLKA